MPESEHDAETLKRNLKNVHEDRALAETQLPRRGPVPPTDRDLVIDPDDTLLKRYWAIMDRLRQAGHEIDTAALAELDNGHRYCVIPSPARSVETRDWVHDRVPTVAPGV